MAPLAGVSLDAADPGLRFNGDGPIVPLMPQSRQLFLFYFAADAAFDLNRTIFKTGRFNPCVLNLLELMLMLKRLKMGCDDYTVGIGIRGNREGQGGRA